MTAKKREGEDDEYSLKQNCVDAINEYAFDTGVNILSILALSIIEVQVLKS